MAREYPVAIWVPIWARPLPDRMHNAATGLRVPCHNQPEGRHERSASNCDARIGSRHPRAVSPGESLAGVAGRGGRAGRAQAELGIIPRDAAEAIAGGARMELLDRARIDEGFARTGHTIVPLVWELSRVVGEPHGGWVHWGATTQNITQTGDLLVLRQAHRRVPAADRRGFDRDGRSGGTRGGHADRRPHPWPARGAGDVRLQGRGVDRRTAAPRGEVPAGGAASVRRDAGRWGWDVCLAGRTGAAGAGGNRSSARIRHDGGAVACAGRSPGGEHLPA